MRLRSPSPLGIVSLLGCIVMCTSCDRTAPQDSNTPAADVSIRDVCDLCDALGQSDADGGDDTDSQGSVRDGGQMDGSSPTQDVAVTSDASADSVAEPDISGEVVEDVASDSQSADSGDVTSDTEGDVVTCKDWRQRGDNKVPWDSCWKPPQHYCSQSPEAPAIWFGCSPDFAICCTFSSVCRPCDWIVCPTPSAGDPMPPWAHAKCPKNWEATYGANQPAGCAAHRPTYKAKFCWDGAPTSWSAEASHANDNK